MPIKLLHEADPEWVGSLKSSFNWLVTSIVIHFLFLLYVGIRTANWIDDNTSDLTNPYKVEGLAFPLAFLITNAVFTLILINILIVTVWKMTLPEPDFPKAAPARDLTRWALLPAYGLMMIGVLVNLFQSEDLAPLSVLLQAISLLLNFIGSFAMLSYLRELAKRIPDPSLATQTAVVQIEMLFATGLAVIGVISFIDAASSPSGGSTTFGLLMLALAGLIWVITGIWWIVLILRFRNHFSRLHKQAIYHNYESKAVRY